MSMTLEDACAQLRGRGEAVTVASLAAELGVPRSTLYRRAGGAAALRALLDRPGEALDQRVAEAILGLLSDVTLDQVRVVDIAEAAGILPLTLYRRYGDRDGMLATLFRHVPARARLAGLRFTAGADVEGDLARFAAEALAGLSAARGALLTAAGGGPDAVALKARLDPPDAGARRALTAYLRDAAAAGMIDAPDPAAIADAFAMTLLGAAVLGPRLGLIPADTDPALQGRAFAVLFVNGILPRRSG